MKGWQFIPRLFLRAPFYAYLDYDLLRLPEVLGLVPFRNAVLLASPVFYAALEKKGFDFGLLSDKERHTLAKYYNRMSFRPTPFGAFSTFTNLCWGGTGTRLSADDRALIHLRPDQAFVSEHQRLLRGDPAGRLVLNPTVYTIGREIRFIRSVIDEKGHYRFSLESVDLLPFYTELFAHVRVSRPTPGELRAKLIELGDCSPDEAADYLDFLLDSGLLFDASAEQLIGNERFLDLEQRLAVDAVLPGGRFYAAAERPLEEGGLDAGLQGELLKAVSVLEKLAQPLRQPELERFRAAFEKRFDREKVPLLLALDPDAGIAYGELSAVQEEDDLFIPEQAGNGSLDWAPARQLLFRLWQGDRPIILSDSDLEVLPGSGIKPSTMASIFRKTEEHLLIEYAGGATAANLSGRFSVFSPEVHELCKDIAAKEHTAHPGILFADISQLSDTHTDNINRREAIYDWEIAINTYPGSGNLGLDDLWLSVQQGELVLESKSLGKRVIPRLATAYNYRKTELGIFRLLCDLQCQGLDPVRNLDLETLFPGLPFYPRVAYGRTVLSLAKWKLRELPKTLAELRAFREKYGLPQRVSTGRSDQLLVFDLAVTEEAVFFLDCIRGQQEVLLQEYLLPDRSVRKGLRPLAGQFVAQLYHTDTIYRPLSGDVPVQGAVRHFGIGSEWVFFKLYCTPRTADAILQEVIAPLVAAMGAELPCWFFIRYTEEGYHLRLRFKTRQIEQLTAALKQGLEPYQELVRGLQADTYQRELERYGPELIDAVEHLFCLGSALYFRCDDGLYTACCMIRAWFELEPAIAFTLRVSESFIQEFGGTKALRLGLDRRYREQQNSLAERLARRHDLDALLAQLLVIRGKGAPDRLLADLIHMQLNRCFTEAQRRQEMIVYHHLHKYLVSEKKRGLQVQLAVKSGPIRGPQG